jgi:hypothetical protein
MEESAARMMGCERAREHPASRLARTYSMMRVCELGEALFS